jgi:hypothetical protein
MFKNGMLIRIFEFERGNNRRLKKIAYQGTL